MSMNELDYIPKNRWITVKELLEILKNKKIEVGYRSISRTLLKHTKVGDIQRKNISEYGRPEYAYKRC
jgi:predicted transcriptional regulator